MIRIAHISDLHFGMHDTLVVESFLADLATINPDIIIITGDLTQRGLEMQYSDLHEFLKQLPQTLLIVPGNHDIPAYNPISRFLFPYKFYKKYVSNQLTAQFINDEINILGINSVTPYQAYNGLLSDKTIKNIEKHFLTSQGQINILFFHHNINYLAGLHQPLTNVKKLYEYLKISPIHIVCTGHLHYANLTIIKNNSQKNCALLHAGSLCSQRKKDGLNSFYVINVDGSSCHIEWRVFNNQAFSVQQTYQLHFEKH